VASSKPIIEFVIPTLNSARVLKHCLQSIRAQTYPKNKIQILIIDGGSTDDTIKIASKYHAKIISNPLKTAEAGKAIGVKNALGDLIALIDSDNILLSKQWLSTMIKPLQDQPKCLGSEPWSYTYRPKGGIIERYSSLTGVNDPYTLIAGNFDRINYLNHSWTNLPLKIVDFPSYQLAILDPKNLMPTIGANGTIFRKQIFAGFTDNYLFDIDVLSKLTQPIYFAKVKIGIIHTFCESSLSKFIRKQNRRATDLYTYRHLRSYPLTQNHLRSTIFFTLYVILIIPMFYDSLRGFVKKPDLAWFLHPLLCLITLYCYGIATIKNYFHLLKPINRKQWQQ